MSERIASRHIGHSKFKKKIKRLYNRKHITKENYEYLLFQRDVYEFVGESIEAWKYINLDTHDKHGEVTRDNIAEMLEELMCE